MKNHWIAKYLSKKNQWWTAEFQSNNAASLKSRRVFLQDESPLSFQCGQLCLIFDNVNSSDRELLDFLNFCGKRGMATTCAQLCCLQGVFPIAVTLARYELASLSYQAVRAGPQINAIRFMFDFNILIKHT